MSLTGNVEKTFKLNWGTSIMTAEMAAILEALTWVIYSGVINAAIFTGSLSTLQCLAASKCHIRLDLVYQINLLIHQILIQSIVDIDIVWIPSHIGIAENDRAD